MTRLTGLLLFLISFVGLSQACSCSSLSWATCDESCQCRVGVGEWESQILNCSTSIPKCFLMKARMYHLRHHLSSWSKSADTVLEDGDGLYDPECDSSGLFMARQCNNTDVCWCVDNLGVRRSDLGDRNLTCEDLAEKNWVRVELKHKETSNTLESSQLQSVIVKAIQERYREDQNLINKMKVKYDIEERLITVDVIGDPTLDPVLLATYMEKDLLFSDQMEFESTVRSEKLELESVLVYYMDEKTPALTAQKLSTAILTGTVGSLLTVFVCLIILSLIRKQKKAKYEKAQTSEMEEGLLSECQEA